MVRRDDSAFRLVVTKTLAGLFRSGEIEEIYGKWFGPMDVPPTDLLQAAFEIQALPE
jgi:glutamate/aspartate transport system substrate-binding protein